MTKWFINNKLYIAGAITGGIAGYAYWKYIGCISGTCAITSKPINSILYFALFGAILLSFFKKDVSNKKSGE